MTVTEIISSGLIVIFLVQQAKRWVRPDLLPVVSMVIGAVIQVLNDVFLATEPVTAASIWTSLVIGIFVGMGASGAYDLAGRARTVVKPAQISASGNSEVEVVLPASINAADEDPEATPPKA